MIVTDLTRRHLRLRREERDLLKAGFRKHETDWEIHRGFLTGRKRIVEARVSADGMHVYTRLGPAE